MSVITDKQFLVSGLRYGFIVSDQGGQCESMIDLPQDIYQSRYAIRSLWGERKKNGIFEEDMDDCNDFRESLLRNNPIRYAEPQTRQIRGNQGSDNNRQRFYPAEQIASGHTAVERLASGSMLSNTLKTTESKPFSEYAQLDISYMVSELDATNEQENREIKEINVFYIDNPNISSISGSDVPSVTIVVDASISVKELIGLLCWRFTSSKPPVLLPSMNVDAYRLYCVDDGDIEMDFGCLEPTDSNGRYDFPQMAMVPTPLALAAPAPPLATMVKEPVVSRNEDTLTLDVLIASTNEILTMLMTRGDCHRYSIEDEGGKSILEALRIKDVLWKVLRSSGGGANKSSLKMADESKYGLALSSNPEFPLQPDASLESIMGSNYKKQIKFILINLIPSIKQTANGSGAPLDFEIKHDYHLLWKRTIRPTGKVKISTLLSLSKEEIKIMPLDKGGVPWIKLKTIIFKPSCLVTSKIIKDKGPDKCTVEIDYRLPIDGSIDSRASFDRELSRVDSSNSLSSGGFVRSSAAFVTDRLTAGKLVKHLEALRQM